MGGAFQGGPGLEGFCRLPDLGTSLGILGILCSDVVLFFCGVGPGHPSASRGWKRPIRAVREVWETGFLHL